MALNANAETKALVNNYANKSFVNFSTFDL